MEPVVHLAGIDLAVYAVIAGAMYLAAHYLLREKQERPKEQPTTLSTRGSYTNWVLGQRLVAPIFAWAGNRYSRTTGSGRRLWYESAWHQLCIGQVEELVEIRMNGEVFWEGPINRLSHPSGSYITISSREGFFIYWGEDDQPINTFLGDPGRVGISSRWRGLCYVVWHRKGLSEVMQWPRMEYLINCKNRVNILTQSDAVIPPTWVLGDTQTTINGTRPVRSIMLRFALVPPEEKGVVHNIYHGVFPVTEWTISDSKPGVLDGWYKLSNALVPGNLNYSAYSPSFWSGRTVQLRRQDSSTVRSAQITGAMLYGEVYRYYDTGGNYIGEVTENRSYNITKIFPTGGVSGATPTGHVRKHYSYFEEDIDGKQTVKNHYFNIPIQHYVNGAEGTGHVAVGADWRDIIGTGQVEVVGSGTFPDGFYSQAKPAEYAPHHPNWDEELHAGALEVAGDKTREFYPGQIIRVEDNQHFDWDPTYQNQIGLRDGDYIVRRSETVRYLIRKGNQFQDPVWRQVTRIYLQTSQAGSYPCTAGKIYPYLKRQDFGINPAHAIADLLFASWPKGLGLDQDEWDLDSLEEVGMDFQQDAEPSVAPPVPMVKIFLQGGVSGSDDLGHVVLYLDGSSWYTPTIIKGFDGPEGVGYIGIEAETSGHDNFTVLGNGHNDSVYISGNGIGDDTYVVHDFEVNDEPVLVPALDPRKLPTSWIATEGKDAATLLAEGMLDLGLMIVWDTELGKHRFKLIRDPEATSPSEVQDIPEHMILEPLPQAEALHADRRHNRIIFSFLDRGNNFRTSTISVDDDGAMRRMEYAKAQDVTLHIIDSFEAASVITDRRSLEELASGTTYSFAMNRWARKLMPGDVIIVPGWEETLRVVGVLLQGDLGTVYVKCISDIFGVPASTFRPGGGALPAPAEFPGLNLLDAVFEVPEHMSGRLTQELAIPRVRANAASSPVDVHASLDDTSYSLEHEEDFSVQSGGLLVDPLDVDTTFELEEGPVFSILGSDLEGGTEDLTGDPFNWRAGRQVALIGKEICFFKKVTLLSATEARLDGLIRARFDTRKQAHPADTKVFVFLRNNLERFTSILAAPGTEIYYKSVPVGVTPDIVDPLFVTLVGKGITPMAPEALRTEGPFPGVRAFGTGQDVKLKWDYLSALAPRSGAGMQPAGAVSAQSAVDGTFKLEILEDVSPENVVRTVSVSGTSYEYSNANMVSDFGSEPTVFRARLTAVRGGLESDSIEIEIRRL